jgi:hypothetical protein
LRSGLIDTLGFAVPAQDFERTGCEESPVRVSGVSKGAGLEDARFLRKLPGGGFMAAGIGGKVWVEASLPKRHERWEAMPVPEALEAARELYAEARQYFEPIKGDRYRETFDTAKVVRLDGVRELGGVLDQAALLSGLALVKRDRRHRVKRHLDPELNQAQTLKVGPKAWEAYLYDKNAETAGKAPEGLMRFEVRGRSDLLSSVWAERNVGLMRTISEVTPEKVARMTRAAFERVKFDQEVSAMGEVAAAIMRHPDLSERERVTCVGYASLVGLGHTVPLAANTALKYRRVLEDLGLTPARLGDSESFTVRLDFEQGKAVYRAAA